MVTRIWLESTLVHGTNVHPPSTEVPVTYSRPWLALVLLAVFATACSDGGVVDPSSLDSSALALSAADVKGDYSLDIKDVGGGYRRETDKFSIVDKSGFNASGPFRTWILFADNSVTDTRGEVTCMGRIGDDGARIGGVVTQSSDPSLIGATMVASIRDGFPDKSSGLRIYTSGFDADFHCETGYANSQLTLNGVETFRDVKTGNIIVD